LPNFQHWQTQIKPVQSWILAAILDSDVAIDKD